MSTGIPLTKKGIQAKILAGEVCPVCMITRALTNIPRDPASRREGVFGALFHVDTWGPYHLEGYNGFKYFLFMTDDATRFTFEEGYAKRSDMPSVFRAMHKKVETQHSVLIRGYRMDGEFTRGPIGRWCDSKHIRTELTAPYQHYIGGTYERVNRTMREKAAPMI